MSAMPVAFVAGPEGRRFSKYPAAQQSLAAAPRNLYVRSVQPQARQLMGLPSKNVS